MSEIQPQVIEGPEAWHGRGMASDPRWQFQLSGDDIAELEAALEILRSRGLAWRDLTTKVDFPLYRFAEKLECVAKELEEGGGLVNIKGFPVDRFNDEDLNRIWYGVCLNLGTPIYQNYHGELLRDIVDEQQDTDAVNGNRLLAKDGSVFTPRGRGRRAADRCAFIPTGRMSSAYSVSSRLRRGVSPN